MGALAKITSKGQITLPKEVRDRHNLRPGDMVEFVELNGETVVKARNVRAIDLAGMLHRPGMRPVSIEEMDEAIGDAVAENYEHMMREWRKE